MRSTTAAERKKTLTREMNTGSINSEKMFDDNSTTKKTQLQPNWPFMINRLKRVHSMTSTKKSKRDLNRINATLFYEPNDTGEHQHKHTHTHQRANERKIKPLLTKLLAFSRHTNTYTHTMALVCFYWAMFPLRQLLYHLLAAHLLPFHQSRDKLMEHTRIDR